MGSWRLRVLTVGIGLVVAIAAAEIGLHVAVPNVDLDPAPGKRRERHPMAAWAWVDAFCAYRGIPGRYTEDGKKTVNRAGFISTPELEVEKKSGTLRVVFLGGSSTACTAPNLPDGETWPAVASARLRDAMPGRRVEFINGALPGYSTFESFGRLWSRIRFFEPDIVVVYHGWNEMLYFGDADDARSRRVPDGGGSWSFDRKVDIERTGRRVTPHPADRWLSWSQIYSRIRVASGTPLQGEIGPARRDGLRGDYDERALDVFKVNLELLLAAQKPIGCTVFIAKQATLIRPGLDKELRRKCAVHYHGFDFDTHVRAFEDIYRVIDATVPEEQVLDATELSGNPDVFSDHIHLTSAGAQRLGELIAAQLLVRLRVEEAGTEAAAPKEDR